MKKAILLLIAIPLLLFAQGPLPMSGPLTMWQIAVTQYSLGEMSELQLSYPFSLAQLNSYSHLSDKTPPFKISDWYGYTGNFRNREVDTIMVRSNCPPGYTPSTGYYYIQPGRYTSPLGVDAATALAQDDVDTYAQNFINGSSTGGLGEGYPGTCVVDPSTNGIIAKHSNTWWIPGWWGHVGVYSDYTVRADITVNVTIEFRSGATDNYNITIENGMRYGSRSWHFRSISAVTVNSITPINDGTYTYYIK